MPAADKCHLKIPFPEWARGLSSALSSIEGLDAVSRASLAQAISQEFENCKAIERRVNNAACNGAGKPYATYVVAATNSVAPLASNADFSDTAGIQDAFNAITSGGVGGRVVLLEGTFSDGEVTMGADTTLEGQGAGTELNGVTVIASTDDRATISRLRFTGTFDFAPIWLDGGSGHRVIDCDLHDLEAEYAIFGDCNTSWIEGCSILTSSLSSAGIYLGGEWLTCIRNRIIDISGSAIGIDINESTTLVTTSHDNVVAHNTIEDADKGIRVTNDAKDCGDHTIIGNRISNMSDGLLTEASVHDILMTDNTFVAAPPYIDGDGVGNVFAENKMRDGSNVTIGTGGTGVVVRGNTLPGQTLTITAGADDTLAVNNDIRGGSFVDGGTGTIVNMDGSATDTNLV